MADNRSSVFILGNQTSRVALTDTYADNISNARNIGSAYQIALDIEYTMGAGETANSIEVKIEFANPLVNGVDPTSTEWYQPTSESTIAGVTTLSPQSYTFSAVSAAATYDRFQIGIIDRSKFMRVSIKETGKATNFGTASVRLIITEAED